MIVSFPCNYMLPCHFLFRPRFRPSRTRPTSSPSPKMDRGRPRDDHQLGSPRRRVLVLSPPGRHHRWRPQHDYRWREPGRRRSRSRGRRSRTPRSPRGRRSRTPRSPRSRPRSPTSRTPRTRSPSPRPGTRSRSRRHRSRTVYHKQVSLKVQNSMAGNV